MRTFHSAQLGQQDEAIQQLRLGAIDFANFNLSPLNNLVPETQVLTLPFIFRNVSHLHKTVDGPVGEELAKLIEARLNMVVLSWFDAGARSMYTRSRPIRTPADMQGLKIRVQTSDLWVDLIRALGANATPLPFGEVYTALQTGVIDGAENNWPSYESQRHFEVARFYSTTELRTSPRSSWSPRDGGTASLQPTGRSCAQPRARPRRCSASSGPSGRSRAATRWSLPA